MRNLLILFGLVAIHYIQAAERWQLQFFHDKAGSALTINDLKFPSPRRGIAVGYTTVKRKTRPAALITSDGGETWTFVKIQRIGLSLFFLNESIGWMVTPKHIWKTEESGRSWRKLGKSPEGVLRVYFADENHGWAVGLNKGLYETTDGGNKWNRLAVVDDLKSNPEYTAFTWITFVDRQTGVVAGSSSPPRRFEGSLPDWMEPDRAERRREWPSLNILVETRDGGKNWKAQATSSFGKITRMAMTADGRGLGLIEHFHTFNWPSEVMSLAWKTGKGERVFRRKDRAITDIALPAKGPAYMAGFEPAGELVRSPVPGKLKVLKSDNLTDWQDMEVDYRANAHRAVLAAADEDHVWVATDTGMILRLAKVPEQ